MSEWKDIESAPYDTPVEVRLERGKPILARLLANASLDEDENQCDQWQAEIEGKHPLCWTDGACWASNHDGVRSVQPIAWRFPSPPETGGV